jgi:hypothetical protein
MGGLDMSWGRKDGNSRDINLFGQKDKNKYV